jgi:phosphatidylserine/phosphatidylglycerophosphate/cardiolipin synthase-like enzyme
MDISVLAGILGVVIAVVALLYARRQTLIAKQSFDLQIEDTRRKLEQAVGDERLVQLYLTREATVRAMLKNYNEATSGDVIWSQCVGCGDYGTDTKSIILGAAARGVDFKLIVNANSSTIKDMRQLYAPLKNAELIEATDSNIRIQGISDKVVIIAFRSIDSYTGLKIRDPHLVKIFEEWFDNRFTSLKSQP